ncbi:MAG: hypothetical protein MK171_10285 [Pirellulales bacterium]|nr:hypothetical protein [Pirellulales bacterium]
MDSRAKPQAALGNRLKDRISARIRSTLFPLWSTEISLATRPVRQQLLSGLTDLNENIEGAGAGRFDKQLFLAVRATATGYALESREYDCYLYRWGPVLSRNVRQEIALPDQCFDLLRATFSPLATIRPLPDDDRHVALHFKGSDLPRQTSESPFAAIGDVYQPLRVKTNATGEVPHTGVRAVSWTLLTLAQVDPAHWTGQIHTGIRAPFGLRRRGRVEHLAVAWRGASSTTPVRFHASHDPDQALTGYEVFWRESDDHPTRPLGYTDVNGTINVKMRHGPIITLFLRSDSQLLAKIPVAPGSASVLQVPVADDPARLRAQAALTRLREQLIDLVARRTLLLAEARYQLQEGNLDGAEQLLNELDQLPGRAQIDQRITSAENNKQNRSSDGVIQARIEKLFVETRKLLGRFLSAGDIVDLQKELNAARRDQGAQASLETDKN